MSTVSSFDYQPPSEMNRRLVIQSLRRHGSLSRRQISQLTGISGSTLTYVVRDLLAQGVLRTGGKRSSNSVGPKQILLEFNPEFGVTAGFALRGTSAVMAVCNAAGKAIDTTEFPVQKRLDQIPALLRSALDAKLVELELDKHELLGIGVGVPGTVDTRQGVVLNSAIFDVQNFPLRQMLSMSFDVPVLAVGHDANYAAIAESHTGAARGLSHFVYFLINYGGSQDQPQFRAFGAALFLGGQIYHGVNFGAGELDYNIMPKLDANFMPADWECLAQPDAELTPFLQCLAREVGHSVRSILSLLDPQAVIIGNNYTVLNRRFTELVEQTVAQRIARDQQRNVKIVTSSVGREAVALGAAIAATEKWDHVLVKNRDRSLDAAEQ